MKTALVTNNKKATADYTLGIMGVREFINYIVGCDTAPQEKPKPHGIWHAARHLMGIAYDGDESSDESRPDPDTLSRILYVGDTVADVLAGVSAGVRTVIVGREDNQQLLGAIQSGVIDAPGQKWMRVNSLTDIINLIS